MFNVCHLGHGYLIEPFWGAGKCTNLNLEFHDLTQLFVVFMHFLSRDDDNPRRVN